MWPGPYGDLGSRKYLVASCEASLKRMGLDYVDIFYHHRPDPKTPLEETMGGASTTSCAPARRSTSGCRPISPELTRQASAILRRLGTPLLIHQPSYSLVNRWVEDELLGTLADLGVGCIAFSPLAQGLLTDKYAEGVPADARAAKGGSFKADLVTEENVAKIRALAGIARSRGQTLAQMAIAWVLRDQRVTSALIGARSVAQLDDSLDALKRLDFDAGRTGRHRPPTPPRAGIDLWRQPVVDEAELRRVPCR